MSTASGRPGGRGISRASDLRSTSGLARALRPTLLRLARRLRHMRDESMELSPGQMTVLGVLFNHGDSTMGELAAHEQVQPPSMTRVVNELERRALVARVENPRDKRQARVTLTEAGNRLVRATRKRRTDWLAQRLSELTPEERTVLRQALPILEKINHA